MPYPAQGGEDRAVTAEDRAALAEMRERASKLLDRADRAIREGMEEAGRVFGPYSGPERRKHPR